MAVFNEIDEGGLNSILTRRLGMPGGSPAPSLAPEIMPQLVLENDRPEWGFLKGEMRCAGYFSVSAVAGQFSYVELLNPASSNSIATIDFIENVTAPNFLVTRAAVSTALGGTLEYAGVCDQRFRFRTMQVQVTTGTALGASITNQGVFCFLNADRHPWDGNIIMPPNTLTRIYSDAVNQALVLNLRWYERVAQQGELG